MINRVAALNRRRALTAIGCGAATFAVPDWLGFAAYSQSSRWRLLFDGQSLDGWQFYQDGVGFEDVQGVVAITDGNLHFLGPSHTGEVAQPGYVATTQAFGDYHLRLDYRYGLGRWVPRRWQAANSGLLYHMTPHVEGRLFPPAVEFQTQQGNCGDAVMIDTLHCRDPP